MEAQLLAFGSIEIDGRQYDHDVVIDQGAVRKRIKKPSKPQRTRYGHTPLSADENIPWGGTQLIVGTGAYGSLPITPELSQEAVRRDELLRSYRGCLRPYHGPRPRDVNAILRHLLTPGCGLVELHLPELPATIEDSTRERACLGPDCDLARPPYGWFGRAAGARLLLHLAVQQD
jgi:hypothetical protein